MKLSVSYSAFNGIELLEYSIRHIRNNVDHVSVIWQEKDWFGKNKIIPRDLEIINDLKSRKLIDEVIEFKIDKYAFYSHEAQFLEAKKRNLGRELAIKNNCTHYLSIDVDEFYKPDEFKNAKEYIINNNIDYSIVEYINYFKLPVYQCRRNHNSLRWVPFICKIYEEDKVLCSDVCANRILSNGTFISVDKTRFYETEKEVYLFSYNDIMMHHMTGIRRNLMNKFLSYSGKNLVIERNIKYISDQINNLEKNKFRFDERFKKLLFFADGMAIVKVKNYFNIPMRGL